MVMGRPEGGFPICFVHIKSGCIIYLSTQIEGKNMSKVKSISLQNLLIDLQNPRYDPRTNQREAIITIVNEQGSKLVALADDIVNEGGLNPSELPMVMPSGDENTFIDGRKQKANCS